MPELHRGTVTFLFTDIEGSTRLLQRLGGEYAEVLSEQQRILRAAFAAHGGYEVDSQGDSFFVSFQTAKDAVAAAVDGQRDLAAHAWPEGVEVKVRMGLHTGEPRVGGERYVGIGVHRAARIGAAGHGGQVLLSSTTRELVEEDLPPGVSIRDLGERRLKDLDQPQRLYQLVIEGLPGEFGPLRTLDVELKRKRRRMYAGAAAIGAVTAAVAIPVFAFGQGSGSSSPEVVPNSVAVIDPQTNRVSADIPVGARPAGVVAGSGSIWVANLDDQTISRINPSTNLDTRNISDPGISGALASSPGAIWATTWSGGVMTVTKIAWGAETRSARGRSLWNPAGYVSIASAARPVEVVLGLVARVRRRLPAVRARRAARAARALERVGDPCVASRVVDPASAARPSAVRAARQATARRAQSDAAAAFVAGIRGTAGDALALAPAAVGFANSGGFVFVDESTEQIAAA